MVFGFIRRKNSGFTITEVLIVISIIAFLGLLAFWAYRTQIFKGYDSRRKTDIYQIKIAVEEYEKDHDCYPLPQVMVCEPGTGLQPYIPKIPCDPRTGASYYYDHEDSTCPKWFRIYSTLENLRDPDSTSGIGPEGVYNYYGSSPNAPNPGYQGGSTFYGCFAGTCTQIQWDPNRPGPECDPNYQNSTCYGECAQAGSDCTSWQ